MGQGYPRARCPSGWVTGVPDNLHMPCGDVAQLVERLLCKQEVVGSIPIVSTSIRGPFRTRPGRKKTLLP